MLEQVSQSVLEDMIDSDKTVVADFFAVWCGPCKMMHPIVEEESNHHNNISFVQLDVDECYELCEKLNIQSVPTFIIFKNKEQIARISGYMSKQQFAEFVKNAEN